LQETWLYISRKIENYKPEQGKVLAWANYILDKRFKDAIRRHNKNKLKSLDEPGWQNNPGKICLLNVVLLYRH
jgi:DNA-directed RNA polymerase specialized sigma24 family protein